MSDRSVPRAPRSDGAVVAEPPLREAGDILRRNRQRLHTYADLGSILGCSWSDLRRHARQSAIAAARTYLGEQLAHASTSPETLLVAGHQPELFHPGVWVKNFALCGLARRYDAVALNLVVDDDIIKSTTLRVPEPPYIRRVLFDRWTGAIPYEERTIADRELFASFAERVGELTNDWPYEPLLPAFWVEVLRQAERTANLGECFAAARRSLERAWGCHNREVPLSALCDTEPFAYFACHILTNLPHFHSLYNAIVADYRRRHGIRDHRHPVPDLAMDGDWLEAPFWIWLAGAPRRERLFVRLGPDRLELRPLRRDPQASAGFALPCGSRRNGSTVPAFLELLAQGIKIRTRALTTTLYARLFLADLFIHGIGGGIYDELTDDLMRRFYHCEPPQFIVLSATRWLPLPRSAVTPDGCRRLRHELRDVHFNPQRHLDGLPASEHLAELAKRKRDWIARQPSTSAERSERFHTLRTLTEELRHPLQGREEQLHRQLRNCEQELRSNAVLQRRDYSFCLYPESVLRPFCTQFLTDPIR